MANLDRETSAFGLISHLTDIKIVGLLQKTSTGGLPDPFAVVYVDEEMQWESKAQLRTPTPHWQVDTLLSIRPSSTIKVELRRRSMLFRFRHKTYLLGQLTGRISELLENDSLLALTDENGATIGPHLKLKLRFIFNPAEAAMLVDTHITHATQEHASVFTAVSGLATTSLSIARTVHGTNKAFSTCISQALISLGNIVSFVDEVAEVHPTCHAAWVVLSSVYKDMHAQIFPDADFQNVADCLREMLIIANQCPDLRGIKESAGILNEMGRVILEVAFLVDKYAKPSFAGQVSRTDISVDMARCIQHCQKRINDLITKFNARAAVPDADVQGRQTCTSHSLPHAQYEPQLLCLQDTDKGIVDTKTHQSDIMSTEIEQEQGTPENIKRRTEELNRSGKEREGVNDKKVGEEQNTDGPHTEPKQSTQDTEERRRTTEDDMMRSRNVLEDEKTAEETMTAKGIVFPQNGEDCDVDDVGASSPRRRKFERRHKRRHRPNF